MALEIVGGFFLLGIVSILIGIVTGMLSALIFKHFRFLTRNPIIEVTLSFIFGNMSYVIAEIMHMSGIISLLTCGIVMAHYTWYNLSH
jgi:NhaP-type Na+/H+ or K+/H+ antiporter